jgi:hypothetical protein
MERKKRMEEAKIWHQRDDIPAIWKEVLFFFLEHQGCFANTLVIAPPLDAAQKQAMTREMELCGFYLREVLLPQGAWKGEKNDEGGGFLAWLWSVVRDTWGSGEDLVRVALLIRVEEGAELPDGLQRARLASSVPCPMVFQLPPSAAWEEWRGRYVGLLGESLTLDGGA